MKEKSDIDQIFQTFNLMIQTQFSTKIQVFKTDNERKYFHSQLGSYLNSHDIIHISSCVETSQQNGVAERKNRRLLKVTRSLMLTTYVSKHFWGEAMLTATYLINCMPSRVLAFQPRFPNTISESTSYLPTNSFCLIYPTQSIRLHSFCSYKSATS